MKRITLSVLLLCIPALVPAQSAPPFVPFVDAAQGLYRAQAYLSVSEITTLSVSPKTLVPAIPGYSVIPEFAALYRTGARYATNGGNLKVRIVNSDLRVTLELSGAALTSEDAPTITDFRRQNGLVVGFIVDAPVNALGGKALDVWSAANSTVDATYLGSPVWVVVWYRLIPSSAADLK